MTDDRRVDGDPEVAAAFLERSERILHDEHMPRVRRSVEALPPGDMWWRPNEASNSVGNLLLHLEGNLRQWIVSGVGGAPDVRRRDEEFERRGDATPEELLGALEEAVGDATGVLADLDHEALLEPREVQGREVTALYAVYHAVEHFSMHAGQIIYVAKLRTGRDLAFYRSEGGVPRRSW